MAEGYTQTLLVDNTEENDDESVWGRLVSLNPKYPTIDLREDEVTLGRANSCTHAFDDKRVSSMHCKIIRMPDARKATGSSACMDVYMVEDLRYVVKTLSLYFLCLIPTVPMALLSMARKSERDYERH